jgi:ribosomal protein S18 acetylase RimI-like enzyme
MSISSSVLRLSVYFKRNGSWATVRRAGLAARRALFSGRMVLFYCDLSTLGSQATQLPSALKVTRHRNQTDLTLKELQAITSFWNPDLARRNVKDRFELGASLWLIKLGDQLAGYGWTLQGRTVEPHYFPLGQDDVHLFDFHVFHQYRGQGLNPLLVSYVLRSLAVECRGRAFIEAAEWNRAQLASLRKTPLHRFGLARKCTLFRCTMVCWVENKTAEQEEQEQTQKYTSASIAARVRKKAHIRDLGA